jgi:DNA-binding MarR family transcriptional regulator
MRMVSNHVSHQFSVKVEAHGVTVAEWVVLRELLRLGEVNPSQIAASLGMTRGAISKLIGRLVVKRLVRQRAAGRDKRFQSVGLTRAGTKLVPILAGLADQNDDEFFGHLTPKQRSDLMATLQEIVRRSELSGVPID